MDLRTYCEQNGQTALAETLGVSQGLVWQWLNNRTRITAERAMEIERATAGQVRREKLRPDINWEPHDETSARRHAVAS